MGSKNHSKHLKFVSLCLGILALLGCTQKEKKSVPLKSLEIRVFTWSDYLQPSIITDFETQTGAKVTLDYFSSNEELLAKLQATFQGGGTGYDVIFPSDYMVGNLVSLGLLKELEKEKLPVLKEFDPQFLKPAYDPELKHSLPFAWGTTGLAVNTKVMAGFDISKGLSWKDFFENPKFAKKVTWMDDPKEVLHAALKALGKEWATASEIDIRAAFDYLKKNKKNLKIFTAETRVVLEKDECGICQAFSGDVLQVRSEKGNLEYLIPEEGATLWTDNLAIPKNAQNSDIAYAFMNFVLGKNVAKGFVENTFFGTPNREAMSLLNAETRKNAAIFPNPEMLKKLDHLTERPELITLVDRLWTELKSQR